MDADINEKYDTFTAEEHVMTKDMWAGSSKLTETTEWIIKEKNNKYTMEITDIICPPSLYKCIDEAVVNAIDHCINQRGTRSPVTWIRLEYNEKTGRITVSNNGPGIEIEIHTKSGLYVPQMIFGTMFSGSNMDKSDESITGGTNGVGIKLANILSTEFCVETVRTKSRPKYHKYYKQIWKNNMKDCLEPEIIDLLTLDDVNEKKIPVKSRIDHTEISFIPDYKHFGYKSINEASETIIALMQTRAFMAAAYVGSLCDIYFNNKKIPINSIIDIAKLIVDDADILSEVLGKTILNGKTVAKGKRKATNDIKIYNNTNKNLWNVAIIIAENNSTSKKNFCQLSIVNGVVVKEGKHTEYLLDEIIKNVKDKITKVLSNNKINFKPEFIYNNIIICASCEIPGVSWTGQTKENMKIRSKTQFASYKFSNKFINKLTERLSEKIIAELCNILDKPKKKKIACDKYYPANFAGKKDKSLQCSLFLPEGDSASTSCIKGITYREPAKKGEKPNQPLLGYDYYGILTTGGVIINVRKNIKKIASLGMTKFSPNEKLALNKFWNSFLGVTGLNPNYKYDSNSSTYEQEKSELRYGYVIGFVDQDHDGVGFIFSLILNMFELLWPNLLQEGYVKRFVTPLRRAYPKSGGQVYEFYNDPEFNSWSKEHDINNYEIKYIKGIAGHEEDEIIHMFRNFDKNLYTYYMNDPNESHNTFEIYLAKDAAPRKKEFKENPLSEQSDELLIWQRENMLIDCTDHLIYEAKSHDISNLYQKLWNVIDGMNESGRKILDGSQKKFTGFDKAIRVSQLAGYISEHENYHHGEASLWSSITGKAFLDVGGVQLPQLQPHGEFGTRAQGGKNSGQPRYIHTKLNKKLVSLIYPEADKPLLKYTFDEGERGEPEFFIPIIPMAILESVEVPAHAWKIKVYARDVFDVIKNVRKMINENEEVKLEPMNYYTFGHKGDIKTISGKTYSFGKYMYDEKSNIINITELPLRIWTDDYFKNIVPSMGSPRGGMDMDEKKTDKGNGKLKKKKSKGKFVIIPESTKNHSGVDGINIIFKLVPNAMTIIDDICKKKKNIIGDNIEDYFMLREYLDEQLNFMGPNREVLEFNTCEEIIKFWFPYRRNLYSDRIDREVLLLQLHIKMLENIIRYINIYEKLNIKGKTHIVAIDILENNKFDKFNKNKLDNPKYLKTEELNNIILYGEKSTYNYLLSTTDLNRLDEAIKKRDEKLQELRRKLKELIDESDKGNFRGASIWLRELDELEKVITEGRKTKWLFGEKNKYKY